MYKSEHDIENIILQLIDDECKKQYEKHGIVKGVSTSFVADNVLEIMYINNAFKGEFNNEKNI